MENVVSIIVSTRKKVCPRTSYFTSGIATKSLICFAPSTVDVFKHGLTKTNEFDNVDVRICDMFTHHQMSCVEGNVIVLWNICDNSSFNNLYSALVEMHLTSLVFIICEKNHSTFSLSSFESKSALLSNCADLCTTIQATETWTVLTCYRRVTRSTAIESCGHNGQPSVQSQWQFEYLWNNSQGDYGKYRVLQRLSSHACVGSESKIAAKVWDGMIQNCILQKMSDYHIYSSIRKVTLGRSLEEEEAHSISTTQHEADSGAEGGDGRASHLVDLTLKCVPDKFKQRGAVKRLLDYGCAEGAITSILGRRLGLAPEFIFGADVRAIPSKGFTFLQLPAERPGAPPPSPGTVLTAVANHSIDLINAAMVFHHVTHIRETLHELRRVISAAGCLVVREHHTTSAEMGAFLDITHGLYSLAWSSPVEWPAFVDEYKAWYRSREDWTALLCEAGFELVTTGTAEARKLYEAATVSILPAKNASSETHGVSGYPEFSNVIKAYYAVYTPRADYVHPAIISHSTGNISDITRHNKRPSDCSRVALSMPMSSSSSQTTFSQDRAVDSSMPLKKKKNVMTDCEHHVTAEQDNDHDKFNSDNHIALHPNIVTSSAMSCMLDDSKVEYQACESKKNPGSFYVTSRDHAKGSTWVNLTGRHCTAQNCQIGMYRDATNLSDIYIAKLPMAT